MEVNKHPQVPHLLEPSGAVPVWLNKGMYEAATQIPSDF
jgi:hypothetical protein